MIYFDFRNFQLLKEQTLSGFELTPAREMSDNYTQKVYNLEIDSDEFETLLRESVRNYLKDLPSKSDDDKKEGLEAIGSSISSFLANQYGFYIQNVEVVPISPEKMDFSLIASEGEQYLFKSDDFIHVRKTEGRSIIIDSKLEIPKPVIIDFSLVNETETEWEFFTAFGRLETGERSVAASQSPLKAVFTSITSATDEELIKAVQAAFIVNTAPLMFSEEALMINIDIKALVAITDASGVPTTIENFPINMSLVLPYVMHPKYFNAMDWTRELKTELNLRLSKHTDGNITRSLLDAEQDNLLGGTDSTPNVVELPLQGYQYPFAAFINIIHKNAT